MVREDAQIEFAEGRALSARPDVARERAQIATPIRLVLDLELDHPGVFFKFIEGILQCVLQGVACLP